MSFVVQTCELDAFLTTSNLDTGDLNISDSDLKKLEGYRDSPKELEKVYNTKPDLIVFDLKNKKS